jgi:hypothetical protein
MAITSSPTDQRGVYPIRDVRVIDGDALDAVIVLPFEALIQKRIRLKGWWADELDGPYSESGRRAKARLEAFVKDRPLWIACGSIRCDKYGRVLADLIDGPRLVVPKDVLGDCQLTERVHKQRRDELAKIARATRAQIQRAAGTLDEPPGGSPGFEVSGPL